MPKATINGVQLYYEDTGQGRPVVFLHEFAGDHRSWEGQVRALSRRYRCITLDARGYPPSEVPDDPQRYGQDLQVADVLGLLDHLGLAQAHLVGCSMGTHTAALFGLRHPERALSLTIAGGGYGAGGDRAEFHKEVEERAQLFLDKGTDAAADTYTRGPTRVQLYNKDPRGWAEFDRMFREHSATGSAYTLLGVQKQRPDPTTLGDAMGQCEVPVLIILGDEDLPGLEGSLFMKRAFPKAGMLMLPNSGHAVNLEEPEYFNRFLLDFLTAVDTDTWPRHDPTAMGGRMM